MTLEEQLSGWTGPSSTTEQDKQDRTERMIREAIKAHTAFDGCDLSVYAKGSYANNTNVKADSDVDISVQCGEAVYWDEGTKGAQPPSGSYTGIWTPAKLRLELEAALRAKFPGQVDSSGSTALRIHSGSARVDADVVPCFDYRYYFSATNYREGAKVFKKNGNSLVNYPKQQLENGRAKNTRTNQYYKRAVRIMKRVENVMVASGDHREVPSFFVECLVYNCPDSVFLESSWTKTVEGIILHIWQKLEGDEPTVESERWREVSGLKYLFHSAQDWNRQDGRDFVKAAWNYLGYAS
ncbi:nucleotidyltransferase [Nocardioides sp. NBC_00850]|uniref:nucleotidyltransferase domain-containing protein n=1 Tax=Nocardioides sp. NBC_00850 TaxID=2976001 RepID=UPI003864ACFC|nr:nucleotidyltransferase [Nocardioides sp. NBC_00850]